MLLVYMRILVLVEFLVWKSSGLIVSLGGIGSDERVNQLLTDQWLSVVST